MPPQKISPLALFIKSEREKRDWSFHKVAEKAGVRQATISLIFKNPMRVPELKTLDGIARAFETPLWIVIELVGFDPGCRELIASS